MTQTTTNILMALAYFCLAYCVANLQIAWLDAWRDGKALRAAGIDAGMTALGYAPLVLLLVTSNWLVIVADVAANAVASYRGVKREA